MPFSTTVRSRWLGIVTPAFERYSRLVRHELGNTPVVEIAAVVSHGEELDFAILYESLLEAWTAFPFRLHAFAIDDEAHSRLLDADLPGVNVYRAKTPAETSAAQKIGLVEHGGLERCLVADVHSVFVQETPELFLLLEQFDFTFVSSPWREWPIQTSAWGFRVNDRSRAFAREWARHSSERKHADASGLPFALLERDPELRVTVVAVATEIEGELGPAPYDFQVSHSAVAPRADALGFAHHEVGRAKIIHLGDLAAEGSSSVTDRIEVMAKRYPHCAAFMPHYLALANRAAEKLALPTAAQPDRKFRDRLQELGILTRRQELPLLLNRRGLLGRAVEVGVRQGRYSEMILYLWRGAELISVDPWLAASPGASVDVPNPAQEAQERAFELAKERLARFGDRSSIWRMTSVEAAAQIPAATLDFVYIDALHDYESVQQDLEAWFGKVRPGGIMAGHDYLDGELPQGVFGVKTAVDEFFAAKGLNVKATSTDAPWVSWWVEIPGG